VFKREVAKAIEKYRATAFDDKVDDRIQTDEGYRIAVGNAANAFKEDKHKSKKPPGIDKWWRDWVKDIEGFFDEDWEIISTISASKISDLASKGGGLSVYAIAIHYRLHAEFCYPRHAQDIDVKVFGSAYEDEFLRPVFEDGRTGLPSSYPADLSLASTYQYKRDEFHLAKTALVSENSSSVAITASVYGTGGYGKTALTAELCLDEDVRTAFPGGIYWLQFGIADSEAVKRKRKLYTAKDAIRRMLLREQYPPESRQLIDSTNDRAAMASLIEALPRERILFIADDIWGQNQADVLLGLPAHVSVIATTRVKARGAQFQKSIEIKKLTDEAAFDLLADGLPGLSKPQKERLRTVSDSFGGWPLLLQLANSTFKFMLEDGTPIETILIGFETFATLEDVTSWDVSEPGEKEKKKRQKFVGYCIEAGLKALPDDSYRDALYAMGVFPDDTDIPFSVVSDYWREFVEDRSSKNELKSGILISSIKADVIRRQLNNLSYFRDYNPKTEVLRIHDVFLAYFRRASKPKPLIELHGHLVASIKSHCLDDWSTLRADHGYGWKNLIYHVEGSGCVEILDETLLNVKWLKALHALQGFDDLWLFCRLAKREEVNPWVADAIESSDLRGRNSFQTFLLQVFGRLSQTSRAGTQPFFESVVSEISPKISPLIHTLRPANPSRTGFYDENYDKFDDFDIRHVKDVRLSKDGRSAYWISNDGALHLLESSLTGAATKLLHSSDLHSLSLSKTGDEILISNLRGYVAFVNVDEKCLSIMNHGQGEGVWKASYFSSENDSVFLDMIRGKSAIVDKFGEIIEVIDISQNIYSKYATNVSESNGVAIVECHGGPKVWRSKNLNWRVPEWPSGRMLGPSSFSINGATAIVSALGEKKTWIIDTASSRRYFRLKDHETSIVDAKLCPNNLLAMTMSADGNVRLSCAQSGNILSCRIFNERVRCGVFSDCGKYLILAWGTTVSVVDTDLADTGIYIAFDYAPTVLCLRKGTVFVGDALGHGHIFQSSLLCPSS
jgi:hypothetical protein